MPVLYLSVYDPIWGNTPHWALKVIVSTSETYYLQVFGEHGTFAFNESTDKDPVIAPHREDVKIWELGPLDVSRVRKTARSIAIDNETVMWNCQDWCIDVIRELEEDLVVGVEEDGNAEDLEEWQKLKDELVEKMGSDI